MIDARISQLNVAGALSGEEYIPITQLNSDNTLTTFYTNPNAIKQFIFGEVANTFCPVGTVIAYAGSVSAEDVPYGWLLCNGQSVLRSNYTNLFNKIGTTYGSINSTTFQVPNIKGRAVVGYCDTTTSTSFSSVSGANWNAASTVSLGSVGGEFNHLLTTAELPLCAAFMSVPQAETIAKEIYNVSGGGSWTHSLNEKVAGGLKSLYGGSLPAALDLQFYFTQSIVDVTDAGNWIGVGSTGNNNSLTIRKLVKPDSNGDIQVRVKDGGWGNHTLTITAFLPGASIAVAQSTTSNIPFNVMQPYVTMNYIIKY